MPAPRRSPRVLTACALVLAACPDRPIDATTAAATTADADATTADTATPPTSTSTSSTPGPTTSSSTPPTGPDATTTAPVDDTTATSPVDTTGPADGTTTATPDPLPACGECRETWVHGGHLNIQPGADLSQFVCLGEVTGHFSVRGDYTADELAVFANLRHTISFGLFDNAVLTDMSAFACLETAKQGFTLQNLPALTDVGALGGVKSMQVLTLETLGITTVPPFPPGFGELHDIRLHDLPHLTDISALAGADAEFGLSVWIDRASSLTSVAPLAELIASTDGVASVLLWNLPELATVDGVGGIVEGSLLLRGLPQIKDLAPLADLIQLQTLELTGLTEVTSLAGLANLEDADTIILGPCDVNEPNAPGMDGLVDLSGLDSLTHVQVLQIGGNANLTALTGAPALHDSFAMFVADNPKLTQADYDALAAQLDVPPQGCFGNGNACSCTTLMP